MAKQQIIAVGLLTQADLDRIGGGLRKVYPVIESTDFDELLATIDRHEPRRGIRQASK